MTPPMFAPPFSPRRIESVLRAFTLSLFLAAALGCDAGPSGPEHPNTVVDALQLDRIEPGAVALPNTLTSIKFAVIGDSGRWSREQRELAAQMARYREQYPFEFVLMLGDNIYEGPATREDYLHKFEEPYALLLDAGVDFYAALGNHDDPKQVNYAPFNMKGERYYSFAPPEDLLSKVANRVEFFALDTTNPNRAQLQWLEERLTTSKATWKICFFHHPLYTTGRYQRVSYLYRGILESLLVRHGVDVVFSGHEHIYQRLRLQRGVQYFVSGSAGSVRFGDGAASPILARNYAQDLHFLLVEIDGDELHFQAISRMGITVDAGVLSKDDSAEESDEEDLKPTGTPVPEQSHSAAP